MGDGRSARLGRSARQPPFFHFFIYNFYLIFSYFYLILGIFYIFHMFSDDFHHTKFYVMSTWKTTSADGIRGNRHNCSAGRCSCFVHRVFADVLSLGSLLMFYRSDLCSCFVLRVFAHFLSFGSLHMFCPSSLCLCFVLAGNRHDLLVGRARYRQAGTKD